MSVRHHLFGVGVVLKGVDGAFEIVGGVLLLVARPQTINVLTRFVVSHDFSGDPGDRVAAMLRHMIHHMSSHSTGFASAYLIGHGVIKVGLMAALLRRQLWAYPAALALLGAFVIYQCYRMTVHHSIGLLVLTVFDLLIIGLIWGEYRDQRRGA